MLRRSILTSAVVGTILVAINQGTVIAGGDATWALAWKVPLTYCVPLPGGVVGSAGQRLRAALATNVLDPVARACHDVRMAWEVQYHPEFDASSQSSRSRYKPPCMIGSSDWNTLAHAWDDRTWIPCGTQDTRT